MRPLSCVAAALLVSAACGRVDFDSRVSTADARGRDGAPGPGISLVQTIAPGYVAATTAQVSFVDLANDFLIAAVYWHTSAQPVTLGDLEGLTWTALPLQDSGTNCPSEVQLFYASVATDGNETITVTQGASTNPIGIDVVDYRGVDLAQPIAGSSGAIATAVSNAMSAGGLAPTRPGEVVALFADSMGAGSMDPGSGYTVEARDTLFYSLLEDAPSSGAVDPPTATLPLGVSDMCWSATAVALAAR